MYNKQLDAFILAAQCHSFSKAAKKCYITPTSLIQQVTLLEQHLGITLFNRSHRGVTLTPAGKSLYEDALALIRQSDTAIKRARSIASRDQDVIRIGTSLLTKCRFLPTIWSHFIENHPGMHIELVPQKSVPEMLHAPLADFNSEFDIQEGIYLNGLYDGRCRYLEFTRSPICAAIPPNHPFIHKDHLRLSDLSGQTVVTVQEELSQAFDDAARHLQGIPDLTLIKREYYDIDVFTQCCAMNPWILITPSIWADIHPTLKTVPLDWELTQSYGMLYPIHASKAVKALVQTAQDIFSSPQKRQDIKKAIATRFLAKFL